ncbi:MAG TPA: polyprenyl synthetase family protein [Candidatus Eisenbergiella merdipullorum]|uniref:Farnesyl diphosphate synthase n=1 Tax=Candidatus Eisenbergiella merdipullorum TaxID=2838553 RepID=A0A9D2I7V5_9FIRM|nr:polyprenyl synthetase family protein [Candidatus Eisenbergiella merdipullorum]
MNFEKRLRAETAEIETILKRYLPKEEGYAKMVAEAANYSVLAGGKRLRPMLLLECCRLFGGKETLAEPFMAAIEFIHTYSLVHDDLPCMDNDEYRRGRKTTHAVYGEGMAVLAGDALLNLAFETASSAFSLAEDEMELRRAARAMQILSAKSGIGGMIGGQCADTQAEEFSPEKVTQELLLYIHENKTAAMIQSPMMIGAVLAGADGDQVRALERIGSKVGLAFQIRDDILDLTGSLKELGKQTGSDLKNHKVTYVSLNGMERSEKEVERLSREAMEELKGLRDDSSGFLESLIEDLITRKK